MPSLGFLVISFVASLLVLVPSAILFVSGWRTEKYQRALSCVALAAFLFFAWASFTDAEAPDFETRAFSLYLTWGVALYFGVAVFASFKAISRLSKRLRHGQSNR